MSDTADGVLHGQVVEAHARQALAFSDKDVTCVSEEIQKVQSLPVHARSIFERSGLGQRRLCGPVFRSRRSHGDSLRSQQSDCSRCLAASWGILRYLSKRLEKVGLAASASTDERYFTLKVLWHVRQLLSHAQVGCDASVTWTG